jgi:hypothetical protein
MRYNNKKTVIVTVIFETVCLLSSTFSESVIYCSKHWQNPFSGMLFIACPGMSTVSENLWPFKAIFSSGNSQK